jgi:hypothetical protein
MSAADLDAALQVFAENPERAFFAGRRPETLLTSAERALGGRLPPTYREFVERLGAGSFGSVEIYGIIAEPFDGPIPDAVWVTLNERRGGLLPRDMIIVGDSGDGGYYCIRQGEDGPVFLLSANGASEVVASDFGTYLVLRLAL